MSDKTISNRLLKRISLGYPPLTLRVLFNDFPRWMFKEMYRKLSKGMYLCALRFLILEFPQNRLYNVSLNRIRIGYIPYLCEYYFAIFQDGCLKNCIENCKNGVKRNE